jgi:hypothetical protein
MTDRELMQMAQNTDRELWRERDGDFYADSIHVTKDGRIGMNVGGTVFVMPIKAWHEAAALRDRLAQPEPEPVAYRYWNEHNKCYFFCDYPEPNDGSIYEPLYTATPKREWVGLTDEEIDGWNIVGHESLRDFVRAIEAKLKEKNT